MNDPRHTETIPKLECVCTADGRTITYVLIGLVRLGGKAATKPGGPGDDGLEPTT